ncbi:MAG: hypothetical protein JNK04_03240 [Myxococcales bacterium]|nr:hypothetical protein [Myxococcales bacterium]
MRRRRFIELCLGASAALGAGCSSVSFVPIAGKKVEAKVIDEGPLALLPRGIVGFLSLDAAQLFATEIGADVARLVTTVVPLGAESGFVPGRDVRRVLGGVYAMQGADFCAVVQGRFDVAAIRRAADARLAAPSGMPLVRTRYGDYDLYTVGNLGFVLLTEQSLLSGNETGMRRALDRLRYSSLERVIPAWMVTLADTKEASFVVAGDFGAESVMASPDGTPRAVPRALAGSAVQPVLEAAAAQLPFLSDMRALRLVGNFKPPGVNLAGALTYGSIEKAQAGANGLRSTAQMAQLGAFVSSFGMGASLPPIQTALNGNDVGFVQAIDVSFARTLLNMMGAAVR